MEPSNTVPNSNDIMRRLSQSLPNLTCLQMESIISFAENFYPTHMKEIFSGVKFEDQMSSTILSNEHLTTEIIEKHQIDEEAENNEFYISLIWIFICFAGFTTYFVLIGLTKNEEGSFDYNVQLVGSLFMFMIIIPNGMYTALTEGWDVLFSLHNFQNAFLGCSWRGIYGISIVMAISYNIPGSLANVTVTFFAFPLIFFIKLMNGNKDMNQTSYGIGLIIIILSFMVAFHRDLDKSPIIGLLFLFFATTSSTLNQMTSGEYFKKIKGKTMSNLFFSMLPIALFWLIFGVVKDLINGKTFKDMLSSIPFDIWHLYCAFVVIVPMWILAQIELCKRSPFYKSIADFIAILLLTIWDSVKEYIEKDLSPDVNFILGVIALILCALTFMLNMKSNLMKVKEIQHQNGKLQLARIERVVNLNIVELFENKMMLESDDMVQEEQFEIVLMKVEGDENNEEFVDEHHSIDEENNFETLKAQIKRKYYDQKQIFLDDHDFGFFGTKAE